jgi:hypothetical protein
MMVTYKEIQMNDQLFYLDKEGPNGKNFLFGFPDSQIHRIEENS